jgi:hypothetical protein
MPGISLSTKSKERLPRESGKERDVRVEGVGKSEILILNFRWK